MKRYEAVIFDLDGVICHTDEYHYLAWKELADGLGIPFDRTINNRLRGVSRMESLDIILERSGQRYTQEEKKVFAEKKNTIYRHLLSRMTPADVEETVLSALKTLRARGYLLAIGSSSKNAPYILERIGLDTFFDAVCDGNQITHSKPDPEVFLRAAAMLGVSPERCLVVEDAVAGAEAAHAGGMDAACVGDAAGAGAGEYRMTSVAELPAICEKEVEKEEMK